MQPGSQEKGQSPDCPDVKGCYPVENVSTFKKDSLIRSRADLREKAFKRDRFRCARCRKSFYRKEYVNDFFDKENPRHDGRNIFGFSKDENGDFFLVALPSELVADHIQPISLGGDEWDMHNIQTLCKKCNREKTAEDFRKISFQRNIERQNFKAEVANRIRMLRGLDMTQSELSKRLGISQSMLSKYEKGKVGLTLEIAVKYAEVFKKDLDYIAFGKE